MSEHVISNPVLRGFNPDPSFVRVGDNYYLATSTFEWMPGVRFYHSRDLVNWRMVGHALTRPSQLDLRGVGDSAGSWAPSLSYADGQFWLIYTNVVTTAMGRPFKDPHTYLVTAPAIEGPWSEPIYMNAIGFDPSLFHDEDGRKWLLNMQWDYRPGHERFAGNVLQEYDPKQQKLIGPVHELVRKKGILCEGPNLYKHGGWYYLMMAEGGTGWNHGISMARSREITGPYELDPQEAVLTTRHNPEHPLQKSGHGELIQTPQGEWFLAHLCSRPLKTDRGFNPHSPDRSESAKAHEGDRCVLGRETAIQRVVWSDNGWLRLAHGDMLPQVEVDPPTGIEPHPWPEIPTRDDFDAPELDVHWQTLRVPADERWLSLSARSGWLRLKGRENPHSLHNQSLVAKPLTDFKATVTTKMEFSPTRFTQFAGLTCWYDTRTHFFLHVCHDEELGRMVRVAFTDDTAYDEPADARLAINDWPEAVYLRARIARTDLTFEASPDGSTWTQLGGVFDMTKLSDDYGSILHFTGAMVGLCVYDVAGQGIHADFDWFELLQGG